MSDFSIPNYAAAFKIQEAMKKSYEDFNGKEALTYSEYGDLKGLDKDEAASYDLNENTKIDLFEDATATYVKEDLQTSTPPIMLCRYIADFLKLPDMQKAFMNTVAATYNTNSDCECENCKHISSIA